MLVTKGYKELIIEHYDQIDLFSYYLDIERENIEYCLSTKGYISNPLRVDKNPSLTFIYKNDKVKMIDAARREFNGDIFDIVGLIIGLNSNNPQSFILICLHIIKNVNTPDSAVDRILDISNKIKFDNYKKLHSKEVEFKYSYRNWNFYDIQYWESMFVDTSFLNKEHISPINVLLINDFLYYSYVSRNEGYCYNYGLIKNKNRVKFYFPFEIKKRKFRSNLNLPFENVFDLVPNEILFLIKSTKDRIVIKNLLSLSSDDCLKYLLDRSSLVSLSSENAKLSEAIIAKLKKIYKHIILYVDEDKVGKQAQKYYSQFGIKVIFINSNNSKDITDYAKQNTLNKTLKFLKTNLCIQLETLKM